MVKHTKQVEPAPEPLVYVVQDYEQQLRGVFSTLSKAAERYEEVLTEALDNEELQALRDEYGEDFHEELDYIPRIVVYRVDSYWLTSYDSKFEIETALREGENYD